MIESKKELIEYLQSDLSYFYSIKNTRGKRIKAYLARDIDYMVYRYIKLLRHSEYYMNISKSGEHNKLIRLCMRISYLINKRWLNHQSQTLGIEINENCFGKGLTIYHPNGIVVHPEARIGENCKLHGSNCIGNNGQDGSKPPYIGNSVDLGVGAKIIGDIRIADNIVIGAGAVVTKSFDEAGITLTGVPAVKIK